jgi:ABC-type maltose transport system permease subunit
MDEWMNEKMNEKRMKKRMLELNERMTHGHQSILHILSTYNITYLILCAIENTSTAASRNKNLKSPKYKRFLMGLKTKYHSHYMVVQQPW